MVDLCAMEIPRVCGHNLTADLRCSITTEDASDPVDVRRLAGTVVDHDRS